MSGVTVQPAELKIVAGDRDQAAAEAAKGVDATKNADLGGVLGKLYHTHGPISGPSNEAIIDMAKVREDAGRAIQAACLTLAAGLNTAAARYTGTDTNEAANLDKQMQS